MRNSKVNLSGYIDIHRHSADKDKADIVLRNLFHNQVDEIENHQYVSVGLHPWHIKPLNYINDLKRIEHVLNKVSVIAIGETGLDKTIKIGFDIQREIFEEHLKWSEKLRKPLIIHCVRTYNEMLEYRKHTDQSIPWIFHWFNASKEIGMDLINKGCYLSFGHILFKGNSKAFKAFREIPVDRIFLETDDAQYSIVDIYEQASNILLIKLEDLKKQVLSNFRTCFKI